MTTVSSVPKINKNSRVIKINSVILLSPSCTYFHPKLCIQIISFDSLCISNEVNHIYSSSAGWDQSQSTFCFWIHFTSFPTLRPRSEAYFWSKIIVFEGEFNANSVVKTKGFSAFIRHQNIAKIRDPYNHGVCLNFGWNGTFRLNPWLK